MDGVVDEVVDEAVEAQSVADDNPHIAALGLREVAVARQHYASEARTKATARIASVKQQILPTHHALSQHTLCNVIGIIVLHLHEANILLCNLTQHLSR